MRCFDLVCRGMLCVLMGMFAFPLPLRADEPTSAANEPTSQFAEELDLKFPEESLPALNAARPSSRRGWSQETVQDAAPSLFVPDEARPIRSLNWTDRPIWRTENSPTWGIHPATPVPTPTPELHGPQSGSSFPLILDGNEIIPVAAAEELDEPCANAAKCAEKCSKCGKCAPCKCENCPGKECQASEAANKHRHGEAAKVILEIMDSLGRSVLDGTVFDKPDADHEWLKELSAEGQLTPREALIHYIRHLESQDSYRSECAEAAKEPLFASVPDVGASSTTGCATTAGCAPACSECPNDCQRLKALLTAHNAAGECGKCQQRCAAGLANACRDCPAGCETACQAAGFADCPLISVYPASCDQCPGECCECPACFDVAPALAEGPACNTSVLRDMASHLDMAANELERREVYGRADQLRQLAGELRQDARKTSLARARQRRYPSTQPTLEELQAQINELRQELYRAHVELEQARKLPLVRPFPAPY